MEEYEETGDIPLICYYIDVEKEDDDYWDVPIGNQVILLNDSTILVGVFGHIILAHKEEPELMEYTPTTTEEIAATDLEQIGNLTGNWHAAPGFPAGYAERYIFYANYKFIFLQN